MRAECRETFQARTHRYEHKRRTHVIESMQMKYNSSPRLLISDTKLRFENDTRRERFNNLQKINRNIITAVP